MAEQGRPERAWAPHPVRPYRPMIINLASTGAVPSKADNPLVPHTPDEIAADVLRCADAGATVFHLHMRDEAGAPVHRRDLYERTIGLIREQRADLVLCVTTSSRVDPDPSNRMVGMEVSAECRPDFASLTLGSFNFPTTVSYNPPDQMRALLARMLELGIQPELEVFELGMVNTLWALRDEGLIPERAVVNILLGSLGSAPAFVGDLERIVERLPPGTEWAAAGIGGFQRTMTIAGALLGGNVRTGLEDSPRPPGGPGAQWGNVDAVRLAAEAAAFVGREVASTAEVRRRYGLSPV